MQPSKYQSIALLLPLLTSIFCTTPISARRVPPLIDNGYDVLVGLHAGVKEDPKIIDNIKKILTQASFRVYNGTARRAYFRSVSILLPASWRANPSYERIGKERYSDAEIVVKAPNRKYGDAPYVRALSGDCGAPGENIHLTPNYVNDVDGAQRKYGDAGKVILHEWGQQRWGLQVEYPDPFGGLRSKFYFSLKTKKFEAVRCSLSIAGQILRPTGKGEYQTCKLDNGWPDHEDCQFYPGFRTENFAKVSVMDRQSTDSVDSFCDKSDDPLHQHNHEAPNRMNMFCGGRSAWEVMMEHEDFRDGSNPARDISEENLTPKFKILRKGEDKCRVSIVIDRSGSMSGSLMANLKKGLKKFLAYTVPKGMEVGVSSFSGDGRVDCPMRQINGQADRDNLIRCMDTVTADGGTSIGSGLLKGIENLGDDTKGSRVFILTDGQQSGDKGPTDADVIQALDNSQVFVDVVCYTKYADKTMQYLAKKYGGAFYFDSDESFSNSLNEAFLNNPCGEGDGEGDGDISLLSTAGTIISREEGVREYFFIDESIGKNTRFLLDFQQMTGRVPSLVLKVTNPEGNVFTETSPEYDIDDKFKTITLAIPDSQTLIGKWSYGITSRLDIEQKYSINVISGPRSMAVAFNSGLPSGEVEAVQPIVLKASLKSSKENFPNPMAVYAEAKSGDNPVLKLDVQASVDCPNAKELLWIPLKDDGVGADREKDDGIYSGYFAAYTATGRYAFSVKAEDFDGKAAVKTYTKAGDWGSAPLIDERNIAIPQKPEFEFRKIKGGISRSATAGAAEMAPPEGEESWKLDQKLKEGVDMIPSTRVADLEVAESTTPHLLKLRWTAPWDAQDNATIGDYFIVLVTDIGTNVSLNELAVSTGAQDEAKEKIGRTIDLKQLNLWRDEGVGISAVVMAIDNAGNQSPPSNLVTTEVKAKEPPKSDTMTTVVIVVVVGVVAVVAIALWMVVTRKMKKGKVVITGSQSVEEAGL